MVARKGWRRTSWGGGRPGGACHIVALMLIIAGCPGRGCEVRVAAPRADALRLLRSIMSCRPDNARGGLEYLVRPPPMAPPAPLCAPLRPYAPLDLTKMAAWPLRSVGRRRVRPAPQGASAPQGPCRSRPAGSSREIVDNPVRPVPPPLLTFPARAMHSDANSDWSSIVFFLNRVFFVFCAFV